MLAPRGRARVIGRMLPPPVDRSVSESVIGVRSYELDAFGHANHAVYLNWLEFARFEALRNVGFPFEEIMRRGWGVYVVRVEVDYLREARLGERLLVRTWAEGYKRSSMVLIQQVTLAEDHEVAVARARVTAVWVGTDRRPLRVPLEIRNALGGDADA